MLKGEFSIKGLLVNDDDHGWGVLIEEGQPESYIPLHNIFKIMDAHWVQISVAVQGVDE